MQSFTQTRSPPMFVKDIVKITKYEPETEQIRCWRNLLLVTPFVGSILTWRGVFVARISGTNSPLQTQKGLFFPGGDPTNGCVLVCACVAVGLICVSFKAFGYMPWENARPETGTGMSSPTCASSESYASVASLAQYE